MKRLLILVIVALIFAAVAGALSQYALGTRGAPRAAQEDDHGDDGGDDHGDDGDGGDGGGGSDGGDDAGGDHGDDGGDHEGGSAEGHTDDASDSPTYGYLDGDSGLAMFEGIVFDPDKDMDAMREAGLFGDGPDPVKTGVGAASDPIDGYFDPSSGAVFDPDGVQYYDPATGQFDPNHQFVSDPHRGGDDAAVGQFIDDDGHFIGGTEVFIGNDFSMNEGGMFVDESNGLFVDPATGQVFDSSGVQFYDSKTGEPIDLDFNSPQYVAGEFTYGYSPEKSLGFRGHMIGEGTEVFEGVEFGMNAGGMMVDSNASLFMDPSTGQVYDSGGVQFYDPKTGEPIELDVNSAQYAAGDFTYTYDPNEALGFKPRVNLGLRFEEAIMASGQTAAFTSEDFINKGGDFAYGIAHDMDHRGFQDLGSDAVAGMYEAMDHDQFLGLDGGQMAGMFAAMNGYQIQGFDPADVAAVASAMSRQDFGLLDPDSAVGMFNSMGVDESLDLEAEALAGLINEFEASHFEELGGEQVSQIVGSLDRDHLASLGRAQALGVASALGESHFVALDSGRLFGLTTAIDANDIGGLGGVVLEIIAGGLDVADLAALDTDLAGEIFEQVSDDALTAFDDSRVEAALDSLDANFFNAGAAGFDSIAGGDTIFDQVYYATPEVLVNLFEGNGLTDVFGGKLFGR